MAERKNMTRRPTKHVYDARDKGACCTRIDVSLKGDVIDQVKIIDGCPGNHLGIEALVRGRKAKEVIELLLGTPCGGNSTSCPDQLAKALREAMEVSHPG
jgi:uncharacterized protein (TIGR03905 family)